MSENPARLFCHCQRPGLQTSVGQRGQPSKCDPYHNAATRPKGGSGNSKYKSQKLTRKTWTKQKGCQEM